MGKDYVKFYFASEQLVVSQEADWCTELHMRKIILISILLGISLA